MHYLVMVMSYCPGNVVTILWPWTGDGNEPFAAHIMGCKLCLLCVALHNYAVLHICVDTARIESYLTIFRTAENGQIMIRAKRSHYQFFPQKSSLACWSSVGSCLIIYSASKGCF